MKLTFLDQPAGLFGAYVFHRYSSTWDARYWTVKPEYDPKSRVVGGPYMYAFWHEYILLPVAFFGHCKVATITSKHHDAEIITHLSRHMGFTIFRGSTNRGGTEALRHLLAVGKEGFHLTMMPDGPRGPRRQMSLGTIYAASKSGFPIVASGMGISSAWRANSWDRFAVPKPFARVRTVFTEALFVPDHLKRAELEDYRVEAERRLAEATRIAEEWAESGDFRPGEMVLDHRPMQLKKYFQEKNPSLQQNGDFS